MTGLHFHLSQRIESLADELASRIERERTADPFVGSQVAVGSNGMKRWLNRSLARRFGIATNVRFSHPTEVFRQALIELDDAPAEADRFAPASLRFDVLALLPELAAEVPEAADLERFLAGKGEARDRAALGIARALADSVDRLVHYRPRLVWEGFRGELAAELEGDAALPLMRELFARLEARLGETHLVARTKRAASNASAPEAPRPPLHVFGVSFLPPIYFEIFRLLAARRAVHLYAVVPSREYFADTASKIERWKRELEGTFDVDLPILAGWGKMSREFLLLAYSLEVPIAEEQALFDGPEADSVLRGVQRDILELRAAPSAGHAPDESLEVHACFGPLRQVEALRERLLAAFSADPTLMPWDIVIMTPEVDVYGPLVRAVFSSAREGLPEIPVEFADVSLVRRAPAADFLLRFVRFAGGRPTVTALAELLEHRAAASRFGLTEDDLPLVRELLEASAMRYGVSDEPEGDVPISPIHTLRAGLRRITLGALYPDGAPAVAGLSPLPGLDGEHLRVGLGLAEAVEVYLEHRDSLREGPRTVERWVQTLSRVLTDVFPDSRHDGGLGELQRELGALRAEARGFEGVLTLDAIAAELDGRLEELGERVHAQRGGVVVSRLTPMRAVPYRVVALLGLDEGSFPRRDKQPSFDLVAQKPKAGDRDASSESRHLLLEALLAARERFLVFYNGRDPRTLDAIPPPTALEDLLETMARMTGTPRESAEARKKGLIPLVIEHPLQPFGAFSPALPQAARSHSRAMRDAAARALGDRTPPPGPFPEGVALEPEAPEVVELAELIHFFRSPHRALLERRLRARFPDEATSLEEREPLEIDHLELWGIRDELLRAQLTGDEGAVEALLARQRAEGSALAHGLDEVVIESQRLEVESLREALSLAELEPSMELLPIEVDVELAGGHRVLVTGDAPAPAEGRLVIALASKSVSAHRLVRAMLEAVCLTHAREPSPVREIGFVCAGASKPARYALPADAMGWLATMIEIFVEGRARAIPLFSKASHKLAGVADDLEAARAASREFYGSGNREYQGPPEAEAPATRVLFTSDPFLYPSGEPSEEAIALARAVYAPLLEAKR